MDNAKTAVFNLNMWASPLWLFGLICFALHDMMNGVEMSQVDHWGGMCGLGVDWLPRLSSGSIMLYGGSLGNVGHDHLLLW